MGDQTKIDVVKCAFGHKLLLRWDRHVLQPMEVLSIADLYSIVVVGIGSWITPTGRKILRKRGRSKKKLILLSMNRRWKIGNKRKIFSRVKELPPFGLWMRSEDKESMKKRKTRFDRQQPTQQDKTDYQSDRVRCQLSRAKTIIIQNISDKF